MKTEEEKNKLTGVKGEMNRMKTQGLSSIGPMMMMKRVGEAQERVVTVLQVEGVKVAIEKKKRIQIKEGLVKAEVEREKEMDAGLVPALKANEVDREAPVLVLKVEPLEAKEEVGRTEAKRARAEEGVPNRLVEERVKVEAAEAAEAEVVVDRNLRSNTNRPPRDSADLII